MHCDQFCQFLKSCFFFWNIRCFLKPFIAQNSLNVLLYSFLIRFKELSVLNEFQHFVKNIAHALGPIFPIFKNMSLVEY